MSYNSNAPRAEYTASTSQTVFPFVFKIYLDTDLKVYQTPVGDEPNDVADLLTLTTDYTVTINGDAGGEITLVTGATSGDAVTLQRELPVTRLVEYQTSGDLLASTLNTDQEYQTYLIADRDAVSSRAMTLSDSNQSVSNTMPNAETQQYLRWNIAANALENSPGVVQEITEFDDTDFRIVSAGNKKLSYDLVALTTDRAWTVPDKDIDFGEFYTKTEYAITDIKLDETSTAQTKIGDLTIGESVAVTSWSFVTTTITINTAVAHNLSVGDTFYISGLVATTNAPNGTWQVVTVVDTDTITFTALATPTGTPTVSSALLTRGTLNLKSNVKIVDFGTVSVGNRYAIDNPFGNDNYEGCSVRAEIFAEGKWFNVGSSQNSSASNGVTSGLLCGTLAEGIVVQTAATTLANIIETLAGLNTHGTLTSDLTSASCRVIVTKIGEATDA